jgi:hypothetical protein
MLGKRLVVMSGLQVAAYRDGYLELRPQQELIYGKV